ncbi:protein of unknown function [Paraburkholderia dioscoreae]|uniref:Uncharacterized protein n=1 Tax=Paraburkholderia dioscoreae TaxID=2604047 RepID=A0A5Q4YVH4_9BURK|nr:protein of unknown function [Paraburkholderia dioscoreae]
MMVNEKLRCNPPERTAITMKALRSCRGVLQEDDPMRDANLPWLLARQRKVRAALHTYKQPLDHARHSAHRGTRTLYPGSTKCPSTSRTQAAAMTPRTTASISGAMTMRAKLLSSSPVR